MICLWSHISQLAGRPSKPRQFGLPAHNHHTAVGPQGTHGTQECRAIFSSHSGRDPGQKNFKEHSREIMNSGKDTEPRKKTILPPLKSRKEKREKGKMGE